jgi:signal peptidase I
MEEYDQPSNPSFLKRVSLIILDFIQTIVLALALFVVCYLFLFQPHQVKGSSMDPNFHNEEYLLTDKLSYHFHEPQRGEVVIFKAPPTEACAEDQCEYIKRIIGLPGERIKIANGSIFINGLQLNETYLDPQLKTNAGSYLQEGQTLTIPPEQYFVCGDNRTHSRDSREFGPIKREAIVGKAFFKYWPINDIGIVPAGVYR